MMRLRGAWLLCTLLIGTPVLAATAAGPDSEQIIRYYRRKSNLPPAQKVTVANMKDSAIKGAKQGELQVGDPPNAKSVTFMVSGDGRYIVFGDVEDLTVDPSKAVELLGAFLDTGEHHPACASGTDHLDRLAGPAE